MNNDKELLVWVKEHCIWIYNCLEIAAGEGFPYQKESIDESEDLKKQFKTLLEIDDEEIW